MDSGADDRSRLRLHVRAAREWLGRAEESLGRADDVRGDLNLMLAQAELTRAKETERPSASVVWARRLAPLFVAVLIAGGGYSMWHVGTQTEPEPLPLVQHTEQNGTAARAEAAVLPASPQKTEPAGNILPETAHEEEPPEMVSAEPPEALEPPETAEAAETTEPLQESVQQARLPSEDMQRLMNSAGQSLRAIQ